MTDEMTDLQVQCRDALLAACWPKRTGLPRERVVVDVDDAAACMVRVAREMKLRGGWPFEGALVAALAAVQGGTDEP